jgi:hypothetical protein
MLKAVVLLRLVPIIVTKVPTEPEEGENDVMVGGGVDGKNASASPIPII